MLRTVMFGCQERQIAISSGMIGCVGLRPDASRRTQRFRCSSAQVSPSMTPTDKSGVKRAG
jgi:hypothetical protein